MQKMEQKRDTRTEMRKIYTNIMELISIFYAIFSIPLLIISLVRIHVTGFDWIHIFHVFVGICIWLISLLRKKIRYEYIISSIVLLSILIIIPSIPAFGVYSKWELLILLSTAITSVFFGKKASIAVISFGFLYGTIVGYIYLIAPTISSFSQIMSSNKLGYWIFMVFQVSLYSSLIALIINKYRSYLINLIEKTVVSEKETMKIKNKLLKLSTAIEQSANVIVITDINGNIEYVNPSFTKLTGYTAEEVLGQNPRILNAGIQPKGYYTDMWNYITNGYTWKGEFCNKTKKGKLFWEKVTITPIINDNNNKIINLLAIKEDITELKIAENNKLKFETFSNQAKEGFALIDLKGNFTFVNPSFCKMFGYTKKELLQMSTDYLKKNNNIDFKQLIQSHNDIKNNIIYDLRQKDGSILYVEINASLIKINNKETTIITIHNISKRVEKEKELEKEKENIERNEARLLMAQRIAQIGYWELDLSNNNIYWNDECYRIFGFKPQEKDISYEHFIEYIHPNDKKKVSETYQRTLDTKQMIEIEHRILTKLGNIKYVLGQCNIKYDENKKPIILYGTIIDITIRKEKEIETNNYKKKLLKANTEINIQYKILKQNHEQIKEINYQLKNVVNSSKAIIIEIDKDYKIVRWNKSIMRITKILARKVIGRHIKDIEALGSFRDKLIKIVGICLKEEDDVKDYEINLLSNKKVIYTLLIVANKKYDTKGDVTGVFIVAQDITQQYNYKKMLELKVIERTKELEKALKEEKRMNELKSEFISVVSHEFRTPLSSINFSANFINNYFDKLKKENIKNKLANIEKQVSHMTKLLNDVLIMGKIQANKINYNFTVVNCKDYFKSLIEEVYITTKQTHKIIFSEDKENTKMYIDEAQGRNIFINLLNNAIKFSPESNEIFLSIKETKKYTKIIVKDTGIGIVDKDNIFKPFVRGENAQNIQGTGLGLSIVKEAVKRHNGEINIISKKNKGTEIEIILPFKN